MLGEAIGGVLPSAVGVALSPVPIIAVILMLATPKGRSNGTAFGVGWILGLLVVMTVVLVATDGSSDPSSSAADGTNSTLVIFGVVLAVVGVRQWRKRPKHGEEPTLPGWMSTIDSFNAPKSFGLGAGLAAVNPKNLALTVAAAASISQSGADDTETAVAVAVFVVLASLTVVGPLVLYVFAGDRAAALLDRLKTTMSDHNNVIMAVICWILAAKLIGDGTGGLSG